MASVQKTLTATNAAAFHIDLPAPGCGYLNIFTRVACYILAVTDPAAADFGGDPTPGAGIQADGIDLAANERVEIDANLGVISPANPEQNGNAPFRRILIWSKGAGEIEVVGNG